MVTVFQDNNSLCRLTSGGAEHIYLSCEATFHSLLSSAFLCVERIQFVNVLSIDVTVCIIPLWRADMTNFDYHLNGIVHPSMGLPLFDLPVVAQ